MSGNDRRFRAGLAVVLVSALLSVLAACSQPGPTDLGKTDERCVLIRDQIYCP